MLNFLLYDGLLAYFLFVLFTWDDTVRDLSCKPKIYLSLSTSEIRVRSVP